MAKYKIELTNSLSRYNFQTTLENITYTFVIYYSDRQDSWYLNIENFFHGQKLVTGIDLLSPYKYKPNCPQGQLIMEDKDGLNRTPNRELLGDRIIMTYSN